MLGGRGRRLVASVIDSVLVVLLAFFLVVATGTLEHAEDYVGNGWMITIPLLGVASYLLLNGWLLFKRGQTVGKAALGIMIVRAEAPDIPAIGLLLLRGVVFLLLPVVDLLFIFRRDRRCLHDLICRTRVVRRRP